MPDNLVKETYTAIAPSRYSTPFTQREEKEV
jgi:hypothetical protein